MATEREPAQVIVLAGPSGSGKSRLAERLGLPVLRLDDFYKDGSDPSLPRFATGANAGEVDWDHPDSWLREDALRAITELCATGHTQVPVYELARDGRTGTRELDLGEHRLFVAEGIFAPEVAAATGAVGRLAAGYCLTQPAAVTFWRRLTRDLREHRKPPSLLVRRGLALMRAQRSIVADAVGRGCRPVSNQDAYAAVRRLLGTGAAPDLPWGPALRQPDRYSCGATAMVVAQLLRDPGFAAAALPRFERTVLERHRSYTRPVSALGTPQLPWPRRLGTAFWSVAAQLHAVEGVRYRLRGGYLRPGRAFDRLVRAAGRGHVCALYVGTRTLPRHVTLVVGVHHGDLAVFDPASGHVVRVSRSAFVRRDLRRLGWPRAWTIVVPATAPRG